MISANYVEFEGSRLAAPIGATRLAAVAANEPIEVSLYLKPRADDGEAAEGTDPRARLKNRRTRQHADDIARISEFAQHAGLTVSAVEPGRRLIKLAGTTARHEGAFRIKLEHYHDGKRSFRGRIGALHLPDNVAPVVEAVLGLDTRPIAKPRLVFHTDATTLPGYLPNQVAHLYDYPTTVTGAGQCIALIELGGGFNLADTQTAFQNMQLTPPAITAISINGGLNRPNPDDGADGEVALDIQVAGGAAPGASIAVYFAPNTTAGFVDAVTAAAHDATQKPSVMSISWGSAESNWTQQVLTTMTSALQDAASLGVSVFVASGDNLATDSVNDGNAHVDFPASSPWAIGCGGTAIRAASGSITAETVWNDGQSGTGGGISDVFATPAFQANANLPASLNDGQVRRGVPDVAGNASPESGYCIVVNSNATVVGGTSAVAPLWAGLAALTNQRAPEPIGFFLPKLYAQPGLVRDITAGGNAPGASNIGYSAAPGWDACTGLGVPRGQNFFDAFTAVTPTAAGAPPTV